MTADVQRALAEALAGHRLTTNRQCFCGEREPYDERDAGFHRPEWHVAHVLTVLLPLIADAEKRAAAAARREQQLWDRRRVEDYAAVVGVELSPGDDVVDAVNELYLAAEGAGQ